MDAIVATLGVVIVLVMWLFAIDRWDEAGLEGRVARGEISLEEYRTIQRARFGAV